MESTIRWILLIIGILVILVIWWDGLRRNRKQQSLEQKEEEIHTQESKTQGLPEELVEQSTEKKIIGEEMLQITEDEPILSEEALQDLATVHQIEIKATEFEKPDIISIYVMAPEGKSFGGYDLLQTILSHEMQYGEMQIFHRYADNQAKIDLLFSLVSATEPGDFDLQEMGTFSCRGLILFMNVSKLARPAQVFELMLETATHLAEDLGGEMMLNQQEVLTKEFIEEIRKRLQTK